MQNEQNAQEFEQNKPQWFGLIYGSYGAEVKTTLPFANKELHAMAKKMNSSQDSFAVKCATEMLVSAVWTYLYEFASEKDHNWKTIIFLLKQTEINEDEAWLESNLDRIFSAAAKKDPYNKATKYYKVYKLYPANIQKAANGVALSLALAVRG